MSLSSRVYVEDGARKNKEHEIEATKLQNAKYENSNEARYLRNEKD